MKAFEIQEQFGIENLALVERPDPEPGPHEALVKLHALSLNYRDLMVVRGQYNPKLRRPMIPVSDGAGEVVAVGDRVTRVKVGDRVAPAFMQKWIDGEVSIEKGRSALGGAINGLLAQKVVLNEEGLVHIPEPLSFEEAATLPCAAVTAWNALIAQGRLKAGDTVLVQGTGGVSIFALQLARMAGARVIVTSSSDEKLERAMRMGASDGINYKQTPNWGARARELTDGEGVDHIVEVGGAGTFNNSLDAVRLGGQISMIGVLAGAAGPVNTVSILMKHVRVQGIFVGSRKMFEDMNRAISLNGMKPVIDRVFSFDEARDALMYMESGAHFGKIVIRV
jgi:NADPH:quinone reductase-like Zn-dependent oxidoreductase